MSEGFIGEIRMFAGTYAPFKWAFCDGQLLTITQNGALYSLIGTIYGGDGTTNFALPDMRGRLPVQYGDGPGLSDRPIGQRTGTETVTLTLEQMPSHNHPIQASTDDAADQLPGGYVLAKTYDNFYVGTDNVSRYLNEASVSEEGSNQAHTNMMPYLCINFIICLQGTYPPRH